MKSPRQNRGLVRPKQYGHPKTEKYNMPDSQVEEIKNRLDIVEVISEYVSNMKQAGGNWKALCPFHNEKTASFMVSRDKQIWHCFGCNEGGDAISFVMKIENIEFPEALKILAKRAGVILKYQDPALTNQKTKLLDILEAAAKFYHHYLLNSPSAAGAREYLFKKRGLTEETAEKFFLGFAPDSWDELLKFLRGAGGSEAKDLLPPKSFRENEIFLAGLSVKKERGSGFYDRFRARIMFPIRDVHGHIVGFTGRLMPEAEKNEKAGGKYVNTPQTLVYDKSRVIYGLDLAKQEIRKENLAVLVEGNMDVISSHQAGVKNVAASSGTAMTPAQVQLLKRYSQNLAISFDADSAGGAAATRGIDVALGQGINIKIIALSPEVGKDPDDYIKKDVKLWREAIDKAAPFMDFCIKKTLAGLDLRKVEDKKMAAQILLAQLVKISDKVEQTYYLEKLSNVLGVPELILREAMPKTKETFGASAAGAGKSMAGPSIHPSILPGKDRTSLAAELLLSLILKYPENLKYVMDYLEPFMFPKTEQKDLYKCLILCYNKVVDKTEGETAEAAAKSAVENFKDKNYLNGLLFLAENDFVDFDEVAIKEEILKSARVLRESYVLEERKRLEREMKEAEKGKDGAKIKNLTEEFNKLVNV